MKNREKYKKAFSALHASDDFYLEVKKMEKIKKRQKKHIIAASVAACAILVSGSTLAYAADIGGIQRTFQLWIHGDQTEVNIEFDSNGSYDMEYTDNEGNIIQSGGGGVALEEDGSERPLSEAELLEHINEPTVEYKDDGTVWVYYYDQKIDITDKFKDNVCYTKVSNGDKTLYMTIEYQGGWSTSPHKYLKPSSFN